MGRRDKKRQREKRRQSARREKRRKILAGALSEEWLAWPVVRTCATSAESWGIAGEAIVYVCRQGDTAALPYCVCLLNLFKGGVDEFLFVRHETEDDFERRLREMTQASGYRIGDVAPEVVSRLFWGAQSFAARLGRNFTAAERSSARFVPQPEGELAQWADKLSTEWGMISPRLVELALSHQVVGSEAAMVFTTLTCRVSDPGALAALLASKSPEVVGGEERDGRIQFDWTGPLPQGEGAGASPPEGAQRLLAQASLSDNVLTVEARTAAWAARFYELVARGAEFELAIEDVKWKSFREILPP